MSSGRSNGIASPVNNKPAAPIGEGEGEFPVKSELSLNFQPDWGWFIEIIPRRAKVHNHEGAWKEIERLCPWKEKVEVWGGGW